MQNYGKIIFSQSKMNLCNITAKSFLCYTAPPICANLNRLSLFATTKSKIATKITVCYIPTSSLPDAVVSKSFISFVSMEVGECGHTPSEISPS
jgi:hypothetical protein